MQSSAPHALYRFYDPAGSLLYVGITMNPAARWKSHSKDKLWWLEVAEVRIEHFTSRAEVLAAERSAIVAEHPRYNVIHNTPAIETQAEGWGIRGEHMPDDCHDFCAPEGIYGIYYPYLWYRGFAFYECEAGHAWTCGWGHNHSGAEDENRRHDQPIGRL